MGDVRFSGPLFDGQAAAALDDGIRAVRDELARRGQQLTRSAFEGSIRRPTGRFDASVTTTSESRPYTSHSGRKSYTMPVVVEDTATDIVVTTDLATYGPWLEGSGSRNVTTRFKGYHGFRRASQELDRSAGDLAGETLRPYVARCN